ncbi:MAG: aldo/keto reductase [Candidatus Hydrogenedentes bacterium]|nr:aldo/keto reductase [Candidatus Hydrogenedentota bacterium]
MERVDLGCSGLSVSPIAFGTWQLSPRFWGDQPKDDLIAAMKLAFDKGINFYDTADAYGDGYAETVLGEALNELPRDEIVVATKVFNHYNPDKTRYPDLSGAHIVERCEASLKRLGIDTIDLYILHFYDHLTPMREIADTLNRLRDQGKIRAIGLSNHSVEQVRSQRAFADYSVVQPAYSFVDSSAEKDLFPYCQAENLGVMVYSPMHKGLLTGKYTGTETFDDFRKMHPDFQGERFKKLCAGVQSLKPMAAKYDMSIYQLILTATLMHPSINVAVCGIKKPSQIAEAAETMGKTLSRPDYFATKKAIPGQEGTKVLDASGTRK